jgi:hypothetical protein
MDSGIGFQQKKPDNPSTKGSLKFKGKLDITDENNTVNARIYG